MNSKKLLSFFFLMFFTIGAFAQGTLCSSATPFCTAIGTPFTYQNVTGTAVGQTGPNYGCLLTQPRPSWFYIKSSAAGAMTFSLTQSTSPGGTPNIDVDFIAYGPFTTAGFATACSNLTGGCTANHNCAGNTEDCSYSASATETMTLNPTAAGQYFIIMITNFAGTAGFITFTQTGGPASDCSITCPNVTSGDGFTMSSGLPLPSVLSCDATTIPLYASDAAPFGAPIVPGVMFNLTTTANTTYSIDVYSASSGYLTTLGPLTPTTNIDYQLYFMNPSETYSFSLCESNTAFADVPYSIMDLASGTTFTFGTWVDDGACQTVVCAPGTIKGVSTFTASCGTCVTSNPSGFGSFNPSIAGVGTHTITYTFAPGAPCTPYVFSKVVTVVSSTVSSALTNTTICEGSSATLTVSANPTQTFSNTSSYAIPDGSATGISSPITVSGISGNAGSSLVSINVNVSHLYDADVSLYLVCPSGYTIALSRANGGSGDNYTNTTFSTSGTSIYAGTPPFTGTFRPEDPLYALSGCASNGVWKLFATDSYTPDAGSITSWSISFTDKNTYSWTPNTNLSATTGTNVVASPTTTTVYSVTASTNSGCVSAAKTITVTVNPKPVANAGTSGTLTCSNTTLSLSGSGGGTYSWTGPSITSGSTTATPVVNSPGTYSLVVTSTAGCTSTVSTVTVPQNTTAPTAGASNSTTLTCTTTTAALTGTGGGTYSWSGTGIVSGGTTANPVVNATGPYTVTVTAANGCTATASTSVPQNTTAPTAGASNSTTLTCTTTTAALTGTGGGTYLWTGPGTITNGTTANPTVNSAGSFTVKVTAANGCTATANTTVSQNTTAPTAGASNSTTLTCTTTTAALTGTGGGTYSWSGTGIVSGGTTANPTINAPGTYTVAVTAANGCTATANTTVSQNTTAPTAGASNSTTLTCTTTTAALTGTGGGTYSWSGTGIVSGGTTANPVVNATGPYTVTVTAANGCTATASTSVPQNTTAPTAGASNSTTLTCTTTTAALTGTGGGTYLWTGPGTITNGTTANPTVNSAGSFTVKVTAANGCTATANTTVSQNTTAPTAGASNSTTLTCTTTTAALTGTGGGTYSWSGTGIVSGGTTANPVVNATGPYTVTVTAANGCTATASTSVPQNTTAPSPTASNSATLNCATNTVALTGGPSSGVTYQWSGPGFSGGTTSQNAVATTPGTYSLTVTNTINSCTAVATTAVSQNTTAPSPTASNSATLTCTANTVALTGGPATGVSYQWSGPGFSGGTTSQNAVATAPGTYSLTVTNTVNSCTAVATTAVTQNTTAPLVTMPGTQTITCSSPSVSLVGSANPTTCTPVWTGGVCGGATSYTASACSPNTYTLTITNPLNGCTASGTVSAVASVGVPSVTASNSGSITCTNTSVQITASTTMTPVSYAWTGPGAITGASNSTGTVSVGGSYQCIVTNTLTGCASTITTVVPTNTTPVAASVAPTASITCTTTSLTLSASPTGSYSYSWTPASGLSGNTVSNPTVTLGGTYAVTITNTVNGCFANANVTVPSNTTAPTANIAVNSITTTCAAPTATLSVTATPTTGATYSWTAPGSGSLNTYTVSNPVASGSGVFTVVVTNTVNGCSTAASQATVQIIPDSAIPTVSVSASSLTITCTNTNVTTALTSTNTISSYSWSPAPTSGGANPVFSNPGTYSGTITASNGCSANVSINVSLDNTVPTVTLTSGLNNGTLTCVTTSISVTPTISPSSNLTYTWTPSIGISTSANQSSATFTAAGIYTLAVTNTVNGCVTSNTNTANTFTVIADNTPPTFTLGTAPSVTTTCASPNATLSASSNADPNSIYTWLTPTSGTLTGNPVTSAAAGIYTVSVTNTVNGCSSSAASQNTVEVVVDAGIPNVNLSANSVSITCSNPTPSVAVSTTATPVTYSWSPTTGIVAGTETTANPSFNAAGSYSVVVTNTNSGCATDITTNVVTVTLDNTIPVISLSSATNDGTITCASPSVIVTPTITPSSNLTYTWSPSIGLATSANQSIATFTAAGVYTLAVTNTLTGCVSTSTNSANTFTVYLNNSTPTVTAVQTSTNSVIGCANPVVSYSANVSATGSSLNYTWTPGPVNTSTIDISTSGIYSVVVMDAVNGCTATTQFTVDGNTTLPQNVNAGSNVNIACGSSSVGLIGTSTTTNVSYTWAGPSATSIISGSNTANPIVGETGVYTLTVTDNLTGCQNTATVNVAQANVAASFTANPTSGISPLTVAFTDQSTGATAWAWNFDGTNSSNVQNPSNTFTTGTYTVTLTASSGTCTSTATLVIVVEDGLTIEIPNVFTPNGDNVNDIFTIKSTGVKEITLQIFNRWGEKLYEFSGDKASWDGITPNGGKAPAATYFFFVKATGFDGKEVEKHGTLNLFR